MAFSPAKIIIWAEGLIKGGNQVEECFPAALVWQRTFTFIPTLTVAQSAKTHGEIKTLYKLHILRKSSQDPIQSNATLTTIYYPLTCWGLFLLSEEVTGPPKRAGDPPDRTAWTFACPPLPFYKSSSRSCRQILWRKQPIISKKGDTHNLSSSNVLKGG